MSGGYEHGKIIIKQPGLSLPLGTMIELKIPNCYTTINLHDKFYVIQEGKVIDVWAYWSDRLSWKKSVVLVYLN